ncbi:MAG: hypothetical protein EOM12_04930 [Verrucomicrobiae bacterium]|nr:hypothetical protein [Verrucomicrobiae bacterium]
MNFVKHDPDNLTPCVFLHIQKTAGSTIVELARHSYGSDHVVSHGDYLVGCNDLDIDQIVDARGCSPYDYKKIKFVSGHFGFNFALPLIRERYSFTILRNPVERILSYYFFCKKMNPSEFKIYSLVQKLSLNEFLMMGLNDSGVKACIWNNQAWQLANGYGHLNERKISSYTEDEIINASIDHLEKFSYIGFVETFEEDQNRILTDLGVRRPSKKMVLNSNPGRPRASDLPPSTIELLNELTRLDQILYHSAWEKYKKKI